jgi:cytochrome c oxidase cbb3-type subunit 4
MDINDARVATTVLSLILFLGIMVWTWSKRRRDGFDEAAQLPFLDADAPTESAGEKQ